jgi:DNA-binding response OmpR family regulator
MGKKILVVDDEKHIVKIISFNLKREGYQVKEAYNGEEALQIVAEFQPDLLITDVMMPKMDGFELCQNLRSQKYTFPIIMLTAKGQEFDRNKGLKYGADKYLTKPFSPKKLKDVVVELLNGNN